jgi:hypothetical protein
MKGIHSIIGISVFSIALPATLFAAEISFIPEYGPMRVYDEQTFRVVIDTEGETVNAVQGTIVFDSEGLSFVNVTDANSILNFWIEEPHFEEAGIVFSGMTPGGFQTEESTLLSFTVSGVGAQNTTIACKSCQALLHDGKGTETALSIQPYTVSILPWSPEAPEPERPLVPVDREMPEIFTPELIRDLAISGGAYTLLFATQDKGSGIDHYEVCEFGYGCVRARSPYEIKHQWLPMNITVIAVDGNDNERAVILTRDKTGYVLFAILILIIFFGIRLIWKEHRISHTS